MSTAAALPMRAARIPKLSSHRRQRIGTRHFTTFNVMKGPVLCLLMVGIVVSLVGHPPGRLATFPNSPLSIEAIILFHLWQRF